MKRKHHLRAGLFVLPACVIGAAWASADVVYRETFGHAVVGTSDPGPAVFDWSVHSNTTGIWRNVPVGTTSWASVNASGGRTVTVFNSGSGVGQAGCNSREDNYLNVNAGGPNSYLYDTIDDGIALNNANLRGNAYISATFFGPAASDRRTLYWTPEFAVDPADYVPGSLKFSWFNACGRNDDFLNLAIRIGAQWYISAGSFNNATVSLATFNTNAELKTVPFATTAANWTLLNFDGQYNTVTDTGTDSTVGLSVGSTPATDLPAGPITAFGIYSPDPVVTGAANRRFDSFTVEGTLIGGGASANWATNGDGNWTVGPNWTSNPLTPHGVDDVATFGSVITAAHAVTVDSPRIVGAINFDSAFAYTLAGPGGITVDVSTGWGAINVTTGSHVISAPVTLNKDTIITTAAGTGVALTGNLTATGRTIIKNGAGSAQFQNVRAAVLNLNAGATRISAKGTPNSAAGTSVVQTLTIAAGASLDLTNNSAIIDYTNLNTLLTDVRAHLSSGRLTSSSATPTTRLGYGDNAVLGKTTFAGQAPDSTSLLIKYTYAGDADLDGDADGVDIGTWATNFTGELGGTGSMVWTQGDWDYDGDVDGVDAGLWAQAFTGELGGGGLGSLVVNDPSIAPGAAAILRGMGITVVPEPGTALLLGLALIAPLGRGGRWRRIA